MNCPRCRAPIYDGLKTCTRCGFSEADVIRQTKRRINSISISKNPTINHLYWKVFGHMRVSRAKKIFAVFFSIFLCVWLFFHFFVYIDIKNGCFINFRVSLEWSYSAMKDGLRYLKKEFPEEYTKVCENVENINPNVGCGGFGGGCFYHNEPKTITISTPYGNHINAAKVIIHETCHVIQLKEGRPSNEDECYAKDSIIPWKAPAGR